jgi:hypothetical protein
VIPQEVTISSLSSALGLSVAGRIQDQQALVANVKLTPSQEEATEFQLVNKKHCGNKTASKFGEIYHVYDSRDNCPTKLHTDKDYPCCKLC